MASPKRGELYWVNFDPVRGVEQSGRRPALIVSNDTGNEHSHFVVIVALSSAPIRKSYPFIVLLKQGEAGLSRDCHINCSQIRTIDQSRLEQHIGALPTERMADVGRALKAELALD
jgi:mRNA interferase MazF